MCALCAAFIHIFIHRRTYIYTYARIHTATDILHRHTLATVCVVPRVDVCKLLCVCVYVYPHYTQTNMFAVYVDDFAHPPPFVFAVGPATGTDSQCLCSQA